MTESRIFGISVLIAAGVFTAFSPRAYAAGYNCKRDKRIDVPIQFAIDVQSAGRIHASASGGSDASGVFYTTGWTLYDASGRKLAAFPTATAVWTSNEMLKQVNIEGLLPGSTYSLALGTQDWCGNVAVVKKTVTMPAPSPELNAASLSAPTTVQSGLMGYLFTQIAFDVTDDSSLQSLTLSIDGTVVQTFTYGDGDNFRWWFDNYPYDSTQSTLEGPSYYISYPDSYKGGVHSVQVIAVDMYGNQSVTSAILVL